MLDIKMAMENLLESSQELEMANKKHLYLEVGVANLMSMTPLANPLSEFLYFFIMPGKIKQRTVTC